MIVDVAINKPLWKTLDYEVNENIECPLELLLRSRLEIQSTWFGSRNKKNLPVSII